MFDNLSEKLQGIISRTHSQELTQDNMQEALREIRRALLEADVNLRVVKTFISSIKDKAEGDISGLCSIVVVESRICFCWGVAVVFGQNVPWFY